MTNYAGIPFKTSIPPSGSPGGVPVVPHAAPNILYHALPAYHSASSLAFTGVDFGTILGLGLFVTFIGAALLFVRKHA